MENDLVTSDGTKVLTVEEYDRFVKAIPAKFKPIFEVSTITGLRYIELQRLHRNPLWYFQDRNQIILPKEAQKKVKQNAPKRTIDKLPATFPYLIRAFLEGRRPPERTTWWDNLSRWSEKAKIEPKVGPKTPRKTIESWMLKAGIPEIEIYSRQGHDPVTSLRHYQSLSFTDYEMREIEKRLTEWEILRK
ncbi:MAG: site-specific integrase [Alphaproteobacteria bacterium]|nr:MAG: site-specific integrase [Alphaproteobacteria bacterium]